MRVVVVVVGGFGKSWLPKMGVQIGLSSFSRLTFFSGLLLHIFPEPESETTGFLHYRDGKMRMAKSLDIGGPKKNSNRVECCPAVGKNK
jgi:hypothetical protein